MSNSYMPAKELVEVRGPWRSDQLKPSAYRSASSLVEERMARELNFERAELEGCLVEIGLFLEITPMAFLEAPESIQEVLLETGKFTDEMAALMEPSPLGK